MTYEFLWIIAQIAFATFVLSVVVLSVSLIVAIRRRKTFDDFISWRLQRRNFSHHDERYTPENADAIRALKGKYKHVNTSADEFAKRKDK